MDIAGFILFGLGVYLAVGVVFALAFAFRGVGVVDPSSAGGTVGFRLLIIPGAAALWPVLLVRWVRGSRMRRAA